MKFSYFEDEHGGKSNKAYIQLYQLLGENFDDYIIEVSIQDNGSLTFTIEDELLEQVDMRDVYMFLEKFSLVDIIKQSYKFLNFSSLPNSFDDVYLVADESQTIQENTNKLIVSRVEEIIEGVGGIYVRLPGLGKESFELSNDLSKEIINSVTATTVNTGKSGDPRSVPGVNINFDMEFNLDGDVYLTFLEGAIIYNSTLGQKWKWSPEIFKKITLSDSIKTKLEEIKKSNEDLLNSLL